MNNYIKSDLFRYCGNFKLSSFLRTYITNNGFRYMVAHRLINSSGFEKILGQFLWKIRDKHKIQIPKTTKIGYGLYIGHGGPIIINPLAIIGNNCNLSQFTTIGSNEDCGAIIGDNVYIGPNVCLVEGVIISDNVTIGAGSVVTKDIPENATAVGNYAKVLNFNNPGRYIKNKWILK